MIIYEGQPKTCAYCGDNNHLIATCTKKNRLNRPSYSNIVSATPDLSDPNDFPEIDISPSPIVGTSHTNFPEIKTTGQTDIQKRPLSTSDESTPSDPTEEVRNLNKKKPKKTKEANDLEQNKTEDTNARPIEDTKQDLEPIRLALENDPTLQVTSFETLVDFIAANKVSHKSKLVITPKLTDNLDHLVNLLETLNPHLQSAIMKRKFTHLINKINATIRNTPILSSSDGENSPME